MYASMLELGLSPSQVDEEEFSALTELFAHNAKKDKKGKKGKRAEPEMSGDQFFSKFGSAQTGQKPEGKKHVARTTAKTTVYKRQ